MVVAVFATSSAQATRCGDDPGDAAALAAIRDAVAARCDCAGAANHGGYVRCARETAHDAVRTRHLRRECKGAIVRCAAKSVCGKPGRVACCTSHGGPARCRTDRDRDRCVAEGGCMSPSASCCEACSASGCASTTTITTTTTTEAPSSTTEASTSTTAAPTTTTTVIACGDGSCDQAEECVGCAADCGTCPAGCGDGSCDAGERCETCPHDCGFCQAQPTIPIAVAECAFAAMCCEDACMPSFSLSPSSTGDVAWTGFFLPASATVVRSYISRGSCDAPGESAVIPTVQVGDEITLNDGLGSAAANDVFGLMKCLFDGDVREFVVPVVGLADECSTIAAASRRVVGFTTIVVDGVSLALPRSVDFHTVLRTGLPAQPGALGCP